MAGLHTPLPAKTVHLCIDMQRMFVEDTEWRTPWAERVMPVLVGLCEAKAERTIFTRFIPAARVGEGCGTWRNYWRRWPSMTLEAMGPEMVDLAGPLQRFTPPGRVIDKRVYSPWLGTGLDAELRAHGVEALVVTGAETDVCVLAAVLGAVDLGIGSWWSPTRSAAPPTTLTTICWPSIMTGSPSRSKPPSAPRCSTAGGEGNAWRPISPAGEWTPSGRASGLVLRTPRNDVSRLNVD